MSWQQQVEDAFGAGDLDAEVSESFGEVTVDLSVDAWTAALTLARDGLQLSFFDWLSAVDEQDEGFRVVIHLYDPTARRRLLLRTLLPPPAPAIPTATSVFRGAAWHERETHEMFGIEFVGHPYLIPLLLPEGFEGHPLRKEFVLAARAAKPWPGAKDPGESDGDAPRGRRKKLPPGVPDPDKWGPQAPSGGDR